MIEQDILSQDIGRRALEIRIREEILKDTKAGLQNKSVMRALENIMLTEKDVSATSEAFERMRQ